MKTDSEQVLQYLEKLQHPQLELIDVIRKFIRVTDQKIQERIKWNAPSYHIEGTDFLTFGPMNRPGILLVFHHPSIVAFASPFLEGNYKDRRLMKIVDQGDFNRKSDTLQQILHFSLEQILKNP